VKTKYFRIFWSDRGDNDFGKCQGNIENNIREK